jgi:hypothetical protein
MACQLRQSRRSGSTDGALYLIVRDTRATSASLDESKGEQMKNLAVAAAAIVLIVAAPQGASAQGTQRLTGGAVVATALGAATGGALGYFYVTGTAATVIGAVVGGFVGDWWYSAGTSLDAAMPGGKTKVFYAETLPPPFALSSHHGSRESGLRPAAFSAASH